MLSQQGISPLGHSDDLQKLRLTSSEWERDKEKLTFSDVTLMLPFPPKGYKAAKTDLLWLSQDYLLAQFQTLRMNHQYANT